MKRDSKNGVITSLYCDVFPDENLVNFLYREHGNRGSEDLQRIYSRFFRFFCPMCMIRICTSKEGKALECHSRPLQRILRPSTLYQKKRMILFADGSVTTAVCLYISILESGDEGRMMEMCYRWKNDCLL